MSSGSVQVVSRIFADQLSPVLAYRRLVREDDRVAPSFLFESVEQGGNVGRISMVGVRPCVEVLATGNQVQIERNGTEEVESDVDPFDRLREISSESEPTTQRTSSQS